jgi:diaminopimelate epimerase
LSNFTFTKMHGIGNDFVMVNGIKSAFPWDSADLIAKAACDRRFGIGADGLIVAEKGESADFKMRMLNPDGSESEMCGNGVRCFAQFVRREGLTSAASIPVETGAGLLTLDVLDEHMVRVDMGVARLSRSEIGLVPGSPDNPVVGMEIEVDGAKYTGTAVSMGNPHFVIFVADVMGVALEEIGPKIENHPAFPSRINVHFVQVQSQTEITQRTWERGAGITLACGTGACACAVASFLNGHCGREVLVHLPGGDLEIKYEESGKVSMTGRAETVFEGEFSF